MASRANTTGARRAPVFHVMLAAGCVAGTISSGGASSSSPSTSKAACMSAIWSGVPVPGAAGVFASRAAGCVASCGASQMGRVIMVR